MFAVLSEVKEDMEANMSKSMKRAATAALAGVLAVGMLSGCGEKKVDGTKTVATVNGEAIPMGVLSLVVREQQAATEELYRMYMGAGTTIWDSEADEAGKETYGEQSRDHILEQMEIYYIARAKAGDYGVEITEEDEQKMAEAAAAFMEANSEETIETLSVTEDQVKEYLELETYYSRVHNKALEEAAVEVTDEEAQQSAFTYVSISIPAEDTEETADAEAEDAGEAADTEEAADGEAAEDETADAEEEAAEPEMTAEEKAQEILKQVQADPEGDMDEIAKGVDETYSALSGNFTTTKSEDEDLADSYPEEVMEVLRTLKEGEVAPEVIETDSSYYIVRLDSEKDEDATESKKESLKSSREQEYFTELTEKWLEEAEIEVDKKILNTLVLTDSHTFTFVYPESEEELAEDEEVVTDMEDTEDVTVVEDETADSDVTVVDDMDDALETVEEMEDDQASQAAEEENN